MLSAAHVTLLANEGCRFLLRIIRFSHHTLRHIVTAARTSRLESLGLVTSQTDIRGVNLSGKILTRSSTDSQASGIIHSTVKPA